MERLLDNIAAEGYKPEHADTILLTPMPRNHIGGSTYDKCEALFPNATVWAHIDDADFWLNIELAVSLAEDQRPFFTIAQDAASLLISYAIISPFFMTTKSALLKK
jgi:glyoxylase-like metal-dependent hydrolase (beta-lactamase superfamily II)